MVLLVLLIKGNQGGSHLEADELQAKVDCFIGFGGKYFCKVPHRFLNCHNFDIRVHIYSIDL